MSDLPELCVFVPGRPAPQGSKRYLGKSGGKGITVESSKAVAPWRADVREEALKVWGTDRAPLLDALKIELDFVMPRPASTPKTRTPPASKRPDLDKLARAVLDAIGSAGVWKDDSQVTHLNASKRLAELDEAPGCQIRIYSRLGVR